ncbi:MAG: YoaK family protein [Peptoanaerobacter stomatis]|uniref:YoaK family protein n=1 Tax=Peptoanaerobacter stomatis TaxID=796937 RepID=UPI003F9F32AC
MYTKKLNLKIVFWLMFLTFTSGYTNCIALLYCSIPLAHHTGNISNLAIAVMNCDMESICLFISAILSFFIGGVFSGFTFYKKHVGFSRMFGITVIIYGILYIILNAFIHSTFILIISTAFIAGSQNGLLTRYKGITTRTTHLSGYLTDCAVNLGRTLRGDKKSFKYFLFFFVNILSFFIGTISGTIAISSMKVDSFLLVGILRISSGLFYLKFINKKDIHQSILTNG